MQKSSSVPKSETEIIHWVNSAKGIGVILIIVGHLLYDSRFAEVNRYIYSFHVPLFFVLSGYIQKYTLKKSYIKNKVKRLLLPFLSFSFFSLFTFGLLRIIRGDGLTE